MRLRRDCTPLGASRCHYHCNRNDSDRAYLSTRAPVGARGILGRGLPLPLSTSQDQAEHPDGTTGTPSMAISEASRGSSL